MSHRSVHGKKVHAAKAAGAVNSNINVTPLVDVCLVLLIIFMVITPMLSRGVDVQLPKSDNHEKKKDTGDQIIVSVDINSKVYVDVGKPGKAIPLTDDQARDAIRQQLAKKSGQEVYIKADARLKYKDVRSVMLLVHESGANQVELGTIGKKKAK